MIRLIDQTRKFLTVTTQQETNIEEIDHLPMPALESRWGFPSPPGWRRRKRGTMISYSGLTNYVDATQAFDVSVHK